MIDRDAHQQLIKDGYHIFPNILDPTMIKKLTVATDDLLDALTSEQRARHLTTGSMIPLSKTQNSVFADLILWKASLDILHALGYDHPTYTDGYIIAKPPRGPSLFWHYDWFAWDDPSAFDTEPPQLFLMYYLTDTIRENGCLRVIPGSHLNHNPLHDLLGAPHSEELARTHNSDRSEFSTRPDEINVPVKAGDLLVGDARLLHAAHDNQTDQRRTLITLWYQPQFDRLPERVKAQMIVKTQPVSNSWSPQFQERVISLNPTYDGDAEPYDRTLYRRPQDKWNEM